MRGKVQGVLTARVKREFGNKVHGRYGDVPSTRQGHGSRRSTGGHLPLARDQEAGGAGTWTVDRWEGRGEGQ